MRWPLALVIALAGCHSILGIGDFQTATTDGSVEVDAMADAMIDTPSDSLTCFGTLKSICFTTPPTAPVTLAGVLNTTSDPRCLSYPQSGGPDLCVIAGNAITVQTSGVMGARPLVLVATGSITVAGQLSASSRLVDGPGPGANGANCSATAGGNQINGGGGGGGGGFGLAGANGGLGETTGAPGAGGAPILVTQIRGGCAGGKGGDGEPGSGAPSGAGGGAVALLAGTSISVNSLGGVYASGAGGAGGGTQAAADGGAGGGGGSGGLIVLEAPMIDLLGTVTANGGGGGGGADAGQAQPGGNGHESQYNVAALGGTREGAHGGDGGDGGAINIAAQVGMAVQNTGGGGGGGGGVGVIWTHGVVTGGLKVSPAVQSH